MKLRPKVLSLVLGLLIVSFLALSIPLYWYTRSALEDELDKRLLTVAEIVANNLNNDLLSALIQEPALSGVKATLEEDMSAYLAERIDGIAIYTDSGNQLALTSNRKSDNLQIPLLVQTIVNMGIDRRGTVSEIYQLPEGEYVKAAAVPIPTDETKSAMLVVWGGAEFMTIIEQIVGSLFWILLISIVVAVSLAIIFSQSLIRPVRQLSGYAQAIQKNIHTNTINLDRRDEFGDLNQYLSDMHQEIRQHEQSTKQLLSGIAHEIKNPLGGMELYAGLLNEELAQDSDGSASDEHQTYLGKITKELHHLKQIVTEYLDYARPLKSDLKPLSIESIFDDAFRILLPEIKQKRIKYALSGSGMVLADESKLRRVFVNLLKNSLEAVTTGGTIDVNIKAKDGTVRVTVSDDGAGIPQDNIEKIFEPYFTTRDKGYGLGLTIAKNIVDEMNGTIIVQSKVEKGSSFTVVLPHKQHG